MSISPVGGRVGGTGIPLFRARELAAEYGHTPGNGPTFVSLEGALPMSGTLAVTNFWAAVSGQVYQDAGNGIYLLQMLAAGATIGARTGNLTIPAYMKRNTAPILPAGLLAYYRYTFKCVLYREATNDGTLALRLGQNVDTQDWANAALPHGIGIGCTATGNWFAKSRQVTGGALQNNIDTGISSLAIVKAEIVYTSGPTPSAQVKLNDRAVLTLTGDAAMLTPTASGLQAQLGLVQAGATAGKKDWIGLGEFKVEQL